MYVCASVGGEYISVCFYKIKNFLCIFNNKDFITDSYLKQLFPNDLQQGLTICGNLSEL